MTERSFLPAIVLALGIAVAGGLAGWGFARGRSTDRFVEVKGLAEREVTADLALWPLRIAASGNDLASVQAQINRSYEEVLAFLKRQGIDSTATALQSLQVSDANTNRYQREGMAGPRFVIEQTVMVRLNKPEVVRAATTSLPETQGAGWVASVRRIKVCSSFCRAIRHREPTRADSFRKSSAWCPPCNTSSTDAAL
jgi:hypothetical protein